MATRTKSSRAKGRSATQRKQKKSKQPNRLVLALRSTPSKLGEHLGDHRNDVWGVFLIAMGVLILLSFFQLSGPFGTSAATATRYAFGLWAFVIPILLFVLGLSLIGIIKHSGNARAIVGVSVMFLGSVGLFHLLMGNVPLAGSEQSVSDSGGFVGSVVAFPIERILGFWGGLVVMISLVGVGALLFTGASLGDVVRAVGLGLKGFWNWVGMARQPETTPTEGASEETTDTLEAVKPDPKPRRKKKAAAVTVESVIHPRIDVKVADRTPTKGYTLPPLDILALSKQSGHDGRGLREMGTALEDALRQHGVDARLTKIVPGPTVTRYEIELAPGVKVNKVTNLSNDIAYALASADVRILAPIPGKSAIGVEVPNRKRQLVTIGDVLRSDVAQADHDPMLVSLGMDVSGAPRMLRLTELPHVLIAGATGAGKSSCINSLLTSLLMRATPEEVRLILVDPKRVELGQYNDVPHLLTRVITNPKKAADALQWAVSEMDRRYDLLADSGVRDIDSYREKYDAGGIDEELFDRFPHIVIVVDELNDLMMVAGRVVEDSIVRIAQMARAVGIHLVLATQRPSVNVITGVIKANVPSRLAFSVASQTDSRVIIDAVGAEKLIGLGDMLVVTSRDPKPERIQGSFVSESEIHATVDWVREQMQAKYRDTEVFEQAQQQLADVDEFDGEDPEIMRQAIELIVRSQLGSTSMLQRKLRIGFARAGRVMDILEAKGVVGPSEGSKARSVLVTEEEMKSVLG